MQVTDPVCGMTIESEKAASTEEWQGKTFHFCSTSCRQSFRAAPERYAGKASAPLGEHGKHGHQCCGGSGHGGHRHGGRWFRRLFGGSHGH